MPRGVKITNESIIKALIASGGVVAYAAKSLGASRQNISTRINGSETLKAAMDEIIERNLDVAENKLLEQIEHGNMTAIIFYLKCKGKNRGYVDRKEVTGPDGGPIEMTWKQFIEQATDEKPKPDNQ